MNIDPDLSDDLSSAIGTETLLAHDLVLEGLPASSKGPALQGYRRVTQAREIGQCFPIFEIPSSCGQTFTDILQGMWVPEIRRKSKESQPSLI